MTSGDAGQASTRGAARTLTLDGLRGIAVLAVVVEHAWPDVLPGGFAGVDVFFVLSGYLITRILVAELESTGRISLWRFYARRVRRILPASLVTIVITCLIYVVLLGPAVPDSMRDESLAATFSVSNIYFERESVDYFAADPTSSPFLHFWSLAVEEQFYLVWPTLLVVVTVLARRVRGAAAAWLPILAVAALGAASLALAVRAPQSSAFFLLPHRGWELIVGGLFAWLQFRGHVGLPGRLAPYRWAGVVAGYALLAVTFLLAPQLGPWPGVVTILPVLGTALLVAGGDGMPGARILTVPPLQFFGRISYALYLWHWPLLAAAALVSLPQRPAPLPMLVGAVLLAIGIATASTLLMEEPIRVSRRPSLVGRRAVGTGLAGMAAVGLVAVVLTVSVPAAMTRLDPFSAALRAARTDRERIIADGCIPPTRGSVLRHCVYGADAKPDGSPVRDREPSSPAVVLFGDSHAMHWFPAVDAWAKDQGLALVPIVRTACPPVDAPPASERRISESCLKWRASALERIEELDPVLVVVSGSTGISVVVDGVPTALRRDGAASPWVGPMAGMLDKLQARSRAVVFLADVPRAGFSAVDCLAVHRGSPAACAVPVEVASPASLMAAQSAAAERAGVPLIDPTAWLCPDGVCTWMAGDRVGWLDTSHLTTAGAMGALPSLAPLLTRYAAAAGDGVTAVP